MFNRHKVHRRHIQALPWLNEGFYVDMPPRMAFVLLSRRFAGAEFQCLAKDERVMRLVVHRIDKHKACSCLHVLWVRQYGSSTYVSYALAPKFGWFFICKWRSHLHDLKVLGWLLRQALEQ